MSNQRHIIKRQVIDLEIEHSTQAHPLQTEMSRIYRQRIVPLIDSVFTNVVAQDVIYRIERLELTNYRGFEHLVLEFPAQGPTVFVGGNGSGKSSILKALQQIVEEDEEQVITLRDIRSGADGARVQLQARVASHVAVLPTHRVRFDAGRRTKDIEHAFPKRRNFKEIEATEQLPQLFRCYQAARRPGDFRGFVEWFRVVENAENELRLSTNPEARDDRLEAVRLAWSRFLSALDPKLSYERMRFTRVLPGAPPEGVFVLEKEGTLLTLDQISDGEAALLLLVGDFAQGLATAKSPGEAPLDGAGVLLIDELDLHLHPSWQRRLLPALQAAFPNTQIIGTTHSPLIVGHLLPENVVLLRDFQASHPSASQGRDARDILLEIMGTPSRSDEARALIQAVEQALDRDDLPAAKANLQALEAMTGADDPAVLRLGTELFVSEP